MALLNYTTKVPVVRSVAEIQKLLVKHGASSIMQDYDDDQELIAISFSLKLNNQQLAFRLPIDWKSTYAVMNMDDTPSRYVYEDQARRVSWRIVKDWVEVQLAIAETGMVTIPQVFLPYAIREDGRTLYQVIAEDPQLLLGGNK